MLISNPIYDASNDFIFVTTLQGVPSTGQLTGNPLGTVGGTTTGEIGVKVIVIGGATGTGSSQVQGTAADGAAPVGNPVLIGGSDGTNAQTLLTDSNGGPIEGKLSTTDLTGAAITFAASGDNTVVAAVASQTTKVYRMYFVVAGATNITIKNGAGASLTGAVPLAANGGMMLDFSSRPWYTTSTNTAFIINSSAAVQVSGRVEYVTSV